MNRWLHAVLATLVVWLPLLLAALLVFAAAALQTTWLRDLVIHEALDRSVDEWSIEHIDGRLLGDLSLRGVAIDTPAAQLRIGELSTRLSVPRLLIGTAALEHLTISDLVVTLAPPEPGTRPEPEPGFEGFSAPLAVDLDALRLDQATLVLADGTAHRLTHLEAQLRMRGAELDIGRLSLTLPEPELLVHGSSRLTLTPELPWLIDIEALLREPAPDALPGDLKLAILAQGDLQGAAGQVLATGPLSAELELRRLRFADIDGAARLRLRAPFAIGGLTLREGSVEIEGRPEDWRFTLAASIDEPPAPLDVAAPLDLVVEGRGSTAMVAVSEARLTGRNGNQLRARGDLQLQAPRTLRAELEGKDLDVAAWIPGWRSRLDLALRGSADLDDGLISLEGLSLEGRWNGTPTALSATGSLELPVSADPPVPGAAGASAAIGFTVPDLDLRIGDNHVAGTVRGAAGELDADLRIDARRLAQLWPGLSGLVEGTVRSRGRMDAPRIDAQLSAADLAWADASLEIASLQLQGFSAPVANGATDLTLELAGARAPGLADPLSLRGRLTGEGPRLTLDLDLGMEGDSGGIGASARVRGDALDPTQLQISALQLEEPLLGRWRLQPAPAASLPLQLSRTATGVAFTAACLGALNDEDEARACWSEGSVDADGARLTASLTGLDVQRFAPLLPPQLRLHGVFGAELAIDGASARLEAGARDGELALVDDQGDTLFEDRIETLRVGVQREAGGRTEFQLAAELPIAGSIRADGRLDQIAGQPLTAAPMELDLDVAIADLMPLRPLLSGIEDAGGSLGGRLQLRGTLAEPAISGTLDLDARARVPALGVSIDPIRARLTGTGPQTMALDASLSFSGVPLLVAGDLAFDAESGLSFVGTAKGDAVPLLSTAELTATASPDLGIDFDSERLRISGRVLVPGAFAQFRSLPEGSETLSRDVVIHGEEQVTVDDGLATDIDLTVQLGREVRIKAGSFEATVIGQLALRKPVEGTLTARGRLETTSGGVQSYGESLRLSRGNLSFDGPIDNPAVDVLAVRNVGSYEVGLALTGYFSGLDTRLYSSPSVDDATALTMLVTGREPSQTTSADLDRVQSAALGLGISQAAPVIDALADRIGIDEIALENPMDQDSGAVVVGKELSRGLYARYTYGLHSRAGGLILEYRINDAFSVRSETGAINAVDLVFRREYD